MTPITSRASCDAKNIQNGTQGRPLEIVYLIPELKWIWIGAEFWVFPGLKCVTLSQGQWWNFLFFHRIFPKPFPMLQCCVDLGDGQFSERCDVNGSFFNSNAIPIIFGKSLTSPSSRLFSLTIGNDYFSIILLILGPIILRLFTDWLGSSKRRLY